jgi:amino acid transporter
MNAVLFTCAITCLLSLINLGSTIAFEAIISLQLMALMATYSISIGCVWYQRTLGGGRHLPNAAWSLGRYGSWVNGVAWVYTVYVFFWCTWPPQKAPPLETVNWAPVMFGGVFAASLVYYWLWGRQVYNGPVSLVRE